MSVLEYPYLFGLMTLVSPCDIIPCVSGPIILAHVFLLSILAPFTITAGEKVMDP